MSSPWLDLLVFLPLIVVGVAVAAAVRARRRSRSTGRARTTWAATALVLVRAVLGLAVLGIVFALTPLGPSGEQRLGDIALDRHAMTVDVSAQDSFLLCPARVLRDIDGPRNMQVECRTSRAVDRAEPPNFKLTGFQFELQIPRVSVSERRTFVALKTAIALAFLIGLFAIERILRRVTAGEPFDERNVWWLQLMAITVALGGLALPSVVLSFTNSLISEHGDVTGLANLYEPMSADTGWRWVASAMTLLILVLAEVWRYGIRLQRESEATV